LPRNEAGHEDQQIANAPRAGEREAGGRIEAERAADQNETALLHPETARHEESRAADRLDQRFDHHRFNEGDMYAQKIQREPDFERGQETLQRLPEEQIAQHHGAAAPDQLDGLVDLRRLSDERGKLATRHTIEHARDALEGARMLHECEQYQERRQHHHAPRELPGEPQRVGLRVREQKTDTDHREQQLTDHRELHVDNDAAHRRGWPHAPAPEHAERHHLAADPRHRQHAIHGFAHPYQMQHIDETRPVRAANQRAPVAGVGDHRQHVRDRRQQQASAGRAQGGEHRTGVVLPDQPQRHQQAGQRGDAPEMLHHRAATPGARFRHAT
ncbi:hypothetical protein KCU90_g4782, partial [Aureobasidium melanogenum]